MKSNLSTPNDVQRDLNEAELLKRLLREIYPYRKIFVFALILYLPLVGAQLAQPVVIGRLIDDGIKALNASRISMWAGAFLGLVVLHATSQMAQLYLLQRMGQGAIRDLRQRLFDKIQRLPMRVFDRMPLGRLMTRVTNDVESLSELFTSGAVQIVGDVLFLAGTAFLLASINLSLFGRALIVAPFLFVGIVFFRRAARAAFQRVREKLSNINTETQEFLSGLEVIQLFALGESIESEFAIENEGYMRANNKAIILDAGIYAFVDALSTLTAASIMWAATGMDFSSGFSVGVLVTFIDALSRFFHPLRELSNKYTVIQRALVSADRVYELEDMEDEEGLEKSEKFLVKKFDTPAPNFQGEIEFKSVSFRYEKDTPILKDVSITIKHGERVALVGRTGSGKSTVAKLLQRQYEIQAGRLLIDGKPLQEISVESWRSELAVVPQDGYLFAGTIGSNLRLGRASASDEELSLTLVELGLNELVERHGGLGAVVDAGGKNFSQGERQLLALARAFIAKPNMLILDEATASVDLESERKIQKATEQVLSGQSALVIAHRLNTIQSADRIIVMSAGKVVEEGSHEELMALEGEYAKLVEIQMSEDSKSQLVLDEKL